MAERLKLTIAATAGEADRVARILEEERIEYDERLDAGEGDAGAVCYLGTAFFVAPTDLERARRALVSNGIAVE